MSRFHSVLLGCIVIFSATTPALAQSLFQPTPLPNDSFRPTHSPPAAARPAAPIRPAATPAAAPKPAEAPLRASISQSSEPTFDENTYDRINAAMLSYATIEVRGGWHRLPAGFKAGPGSTGPEVALLRQRLAITEDLAADKEAGDVYDQALVDAVKRFQARHGLPENGAVGPQTLEALNVPVTQRLRQLAASLDRLHGLGFTFGQRYVVVNIPAAVAEVVAGGKVERRYVVVVGKVDRPSPTLTTNITAVNLNPTWTVPLSIAKKDIVTRMRKDPGYLGRMRMRVLDGQGHELDAKTVDWSSDRSPNFTIRQDSGNGNALGNVRIDMPNPHSVYMHDTNHRNLFSADYRFQSSGCTRVADPRALAAWVLADTPGWSRKEIDAGIATGRKIDIRLSRPIPVAWIYLTGWASRDGTVHFRNDVYGHDKVNTRQFMADVPKPIQLSQARTSGFVLQSGESTPVGFKPVSYLDSR